jgi:hypothetical protein
MIEPQVFAHYMSILADRHGRAFAAPTLKLYYDLLSPALSTQEFCAAVGLSVRDDKFFPAASELIEKVKPRPNPKLNAQRSFDHIKSLVQRYGFQWIPETELARLKPSAHAALVAVGGMRQIAYMNPDHERFVRERYEEAYEAFQLREAQLRDADAAISDAGHHIQQMVSQSTKALLPPSSRRPS